MSVFSLSKFYYVILSLYANCEMKLFTFDTIIKFNCNVGLSTYLYFNTSAELIDKDINTFRPLMKLLIIIFFRSMSKLFQVKTKY